MPILVRPMIPFDSMQSVLSVGRAAWLSGHSHLFNSAEITQFNAVPNPDELFTFSWTVPSTGVTLIALDGDDIVGALCLRPHPSNGERGLVEPMSVLPGRQRTGIGTALWNYAKAFSRNRGDSGLAVHALDRNPKASGFYRKMGGKAVGLASFAFGQHVEPATCFHFDNI